MKNSLFLVIFCIFCLTASHLRSQTLGDAADLPFSLELEEATQEDLPGLHSFALGKWEEWWVVIGGRINGLHGFFVATGFPEDKANAAVRLINPETGEHLQYEVEDLAVPFPDALKSTNPQYAQDGSILYITGGYGKNLANGSFQTFPTLTAVDLPLLVSKMLNQQNPSTAFRQIEYENFRVCGGEMEKMGDWFYLVGGHDFSGLYNQNGPPQFNQAYTHEIRKFRITQNGGNLSVSDYTAHHDETNLHRRDFTLAPLIRPDGSEAICLYGGVFRPDEDLPFYHPVYIAEDAVFDIDESYEQVFSQYTCPVVPLFDSIDGSMYSVFFAGLSVHTWDTDDKTLKYDSRVPFIKDITTFRRKADGTSREFVMPQRFDELLGANMVFVPSEAAPQFNNEVFKLRSMTGSTFVGYLYGGIKAEIPNITPSSASKRLFKVWITPKQTTDSREPETTGPGIQVSPNPFSSGDRLLIRSFSKIDQAALYHADGRTAAVFDHPENDRWESASRVLDRLPAGLYLLKISGNGFIKAVKLVKK